MKKTLSRTPIIISLLLSVTFHAGAQLLDLGNVLSAGTNDAGLMFREYIRPVTTSLGANLNSGWYNTAKPHGLLGFHITFTTSVAIVPEDAKTYDLSLLDLDASVSGSSTASTAMGEKGSGPTLSYTENVQGVGDVTLFSFDHPGGLGIGFLPSPMISAGIGLIKDTEINGRYMPTIKYGDNKENSVDLWGIGIKHSLKQWIPVVKRVPAFQLSLQYGFTSLKWHTEFDPITPEDIIPQANLSGNDRDQTTGIIWEDQNMDFQTNAHTVNLLVGADIPVVSFYGGGGLSITKSTLVTNGWYPIPTVITQATPGLAIGDVVVTNPSAMEKPLDIEIGAKDGSNLKPRLNAGIRFKMAVVTIHFDYTYADYSVATAGVGIAWR